VQVLVEIHRYVARSLIHLTHTISHFLSDNLPQAPKLILRSAYAWSMAEVTCLRKRVTSLVMGIPLQPVANSSIWIVFRRRTTNTVEMAFILYDKNERKYVNLFFRKLVLHCVYNLYSQSAARLGLRNISCHTRHLNCAGGREGGRE